MLKIQNIDNFNFQTLVFTLKAFYKTSDEI